MTATRATTASAIAPTKSASARTTAGFPATRDKDARAIAGAMGEAEGKEPALQGPSVIALNDHCRW